MVLLARGRRLLAVVATLLLTASLTAVVMIASSSAADAMTARCHQAWTAWFRRGSPSAAAYIESHWSDCRPGD